MKIQKNMNDVIVKFIYQSSQIFESKYKINEKMETIIHEFSSKINENVNSLVFISDGRQLKEDCYKKALHEIMNFVNIEEKRITILVFKMDKESKNYLADKDNINIIILIGYKKLLRLRGTKKEPIKNIIKRGNPEVSELTFNYNNTQVDLNKKFEDIAEQNDKEDKLLILKAIQIRVNFFNNKIGNKNILFFPKEKIVDICNKYCQDNNLNINDLNFSTRYGQINFEETLNQLYNRINNDRNANETFRNLNNNFTNHNSISNYNPIKDIDIIVSEINKESCFKKNKRCVIIISSIIGVLIIAAVIVIIIIFTKSKDKKKNIYPFIEEESTDNAENTDNPKATDLLKKTNEPIIELTNKPLNPKKECNSGYYIPEDDSKLEDCQKCSLEGCIKCSGTYKSNKCIDCGNLISVFENGKIIKCNNLSKNKNICDLGEEEKCLTCVENKKECKTCNIGYKLVEGKCKPDFFMKAVYFTKQKDDKIDIITDYSIVNHIITEGNKTELNSNSYQFKEEGYQTVYFQFKNNYYYHEGLFEKIKHLKSIVVSDFDEYYIGIPLGSMFYGCTNLTSVDFSKLSYEYSSSLEHLFNGCINLTYVNIKNLKADSTSYMFKDCKLLTSIDLSNLDVTNTEKLNFMFANCTSLKEVNLKGFKLDKATTIESIFNNCYSLKYLDFSALKPNKLSKVFNAFVNCTSLTSINLLDFYSELTDMENLFFNCSSLTQVDLTDLNTQYVEYMNNMFYGCKSLTSIIFGQNFVMNNVKYIGSMFAHCHSLKEINIDLRITDKISSLSFLFFDCYSLTSINLKNFDTSNINDFNSMFHNCYNLKNIDISNFKFKRNANIKNMFSGCYSLTSMDFSKIEPTYCLFDEIFYDCPNLKYLNFSFLHYMSYSDTHNHYIFNTNISSSGTVILNREYYNEFLTDIDNIPPEGWELKLED